jgi:hypothetical protein
VNRCVISALEFSRADYAHALLQMPAGNVSFERSLEEQLLRLAVHEIVASNKIYSREERVFRLQALLCWVLYLGMQMQKNHSVGREKAC